MMLLDTNVVSEVVTPLTGVVIDWLNSVDGGELHLSSVSVGEIEYGLDILPDGKHRDELRRGFDAFLACAFAFRRLPYEEAAAKHYGRVMGEHRRRGRPLFAPDGQIAAVARTRDLALATRNTADFRDCGLEVVNPWGEG